MEALKKHRGFASVALRYGLTLTLLWSLISKFTAPEMVAGLFSNLGFGFVTPGLVTVIGIGLAVMALLLMTGKYLQIAGVLLTIYFLGSLIAGAFAGEAAFSVGPAIWKDFSLLGIALYFALGGGEPAGMKQPEHSAHESHE